jgi:hypothetical protein
VLIKVKIPADLSHNGKTFWKEVKIDSCISDLVRALQQAGIDMRGSCCGHGKDQGQIDLADGRFLLILNGIEVERAKEKILRWALEDRLGPCRYDRHNYCQTHALHEKPCPWEIVRKAQAI